MKLTKENMIYAIYREPLPEWLLISGVKFCPFLKGLMPKDWFEIYENNLKGKNGIS